MEMVDGKPEAVTLPDVILLGNVPKERAQRQITKDYGDQVTVFEVQANTTVYEMAVEDFIKVATVKSGSTSTDDNDSESEDEN